MVDSYVKLNWSDLIHFQEEHSLQRLPVKINYSNFCTLGSAHEKSVDVAPKSKFPCAHGSTQIDMSDLIDSNVNLFLVLNWRIMFGNKKFDVWTGAHKKKIIEATFSLLAMFWYRVFSTTRPASTQIGTPTWRTWRNQWLRALILLQNPYHYFLTLLGTSREKQG